MSKIRFSCSKGHVTEIENDGSASSEIAIRQTRLRFKDAECDKNIGGRSQCHAPVEEKQAEGAEAASSPA